VIIALIALADESHIGRCRYAMHYSFLFRIRIPLMVKKTNDKGKK
jgi:hypothetical protein